MDESLRPGSETPSEHQRGPQTEVKKLSEAREFGAGQSDLTAPKPQKVETTVKQPEIPDSGPVQKFLVDGIEITSGKAAELESLKKFITDQGQSSTLPDPASTERSIESFFSHNQP